jgi:tRNA(His) guanylyltransferase
MSEDDLGDRMKMYEAMEAGRHCLPRLPIMLRLDGKSFHTFTQGLARPYDQRMSHAMIFTTRQLVHETNALIGYTQSDEISLVLWAENFESEMFFNGRIQKLCSVVASMCSVYFNEFKDAAGIHPDKRAFFDCRVWTVPNQEEAANTILWRELDASKNSISMAAHAVYSHKELHGKSGSEKQEMLFQKGINWNDYPTFFKRGTFIRRVRRMTKFSTDELERLPEKHEARQNPNLEIERWSMEEIKMPPFNKVLNRVGVIFNGEDPITATIND